MNQTSYEKKVDKFQSLVGDLIKLFPKSKPYWDYWLNPSIIKRAFPCMSGLNQNQLALFKPHTEKLEI